MQAIGKILSTHGVKGDVTFEHSLSGDIQFKDWDALLIELLPGSNIPFFIEKIKVQTDTSCLVKLEEIDSPEVAREILGKNVFISPNVDMTSVQVDVAADSYIGYTLFDKKKEIGIIDNILNPKSNPLFIIHENLENELLIPANEELILKIDEKQKLIWLEIADGLL